ncbi:GNAT family N-acetyltransferase [Tellurirhabdus rosea]|uniref:GNAT family N-acetyltransferase n=1 Tax=Tellurirhabdus rosea TaxID=2674997 RepID=UPI00225593C4|nr:GNAT family N-acetyltransferase [Tellurirhabdus rosea]
MTLNQAKNRFELLTDGKLSIVEFIQHGPQTLALTHTEVHPDLEGQGIGSRLVKSVLEYLEQHNLKMLPYCPFVEAYVRRHPEWNRLLSDDYYPSEEF